MGLFSAISGIFKVVAPIASVLFPGAAPVIAGIGKALQLFSPSTTTQLARAGSQVSERSQGSPKKTIDDFYALGTGWAGQTDISNSPLIS
jgi:hypothetical protein